MQQGAALARIPVQLDGDDLLFLQYIGGTTGLSKGACLSHRNLVANTEQFKGMMPSMLRPGAEVVVTAIPLYHIMALMVNFITYFSVGADNWLVANPRDMDGFVNVMKQARPSIFIGVNTLYAGLAMHPRIGEVDFSNLRLSGGGWRHFGQVESRHRQLHPGRLWSVGNFAGAVFQPGHDQGLQRHYRTAGAGHRYQVA